MLCDGKEAEKKEKVEYHTIWHLHNLSIFLWRIVLLVKDYTLFFCREVLVQLMTVCVFKNKLSIRKVFVLEHCSLKVNSCFFKRINDRTGRKKLWWGWREDFYYFIIWWVLILTLLTFFIRIIALIPGPPILSQIGLLSDWARRIFRFILSEISYFGITELKSWVWWSSRLSA